MTTQQANLKPMQVTHTNFIVPFNSNGKEYTIWIAQPSEEELRSIAKPLGRIFTLLKRQEVDALVLLQDWDMICDEEIQQAKNPEALQRALDAFFARKIDAGNVFNDEGGIEKEIIQDPTVLKNIKATLLFISALYRYATPTLQASDMRDMITSLNAMGYKEHIAKSARSRKEEMEANTKTDATL